ncbi:hypothetical protein GCM10020331_049400 [Ectobacillus funiculus]
MRSHPTWFPKGQEVEIIEEMMQQVLKLKRVDIRKLREEAAIMMSCKASIKANQYITNDEIFLRCLRICVRQQTHIHVRMADQFLCIIQRMSWRRYLKG